MAKKLSSNPTMEELLSSYTTKLQTVSKNQKVEGEVIAISGKEIILDIKAKSDATLAKKELKDEDLKNLKIGDKIQAFVFLSENESNQVVLSLHQHIPTKVGRGGRGISLSKFIQAQSQKSEISGKILEINKGGLLVEADSIRGFLPNSQIGFETLSKIKDGSDLLGSQIKVFVIETDEKENRLVFSQKGMVLESDLAKLKQFKKGDKLKGKIVGVFPFALAVLINDVVGLVFSSDVSWEKDSDLSKFEKAQELEVQVLGLDEDLGRLNLSIKHTKEDPFTKLVDQFQADDIVKGEVLSVDETGVAIKLAEGVEGLLPAAKIDSENTYQVGQTVTVLIDTVDTKKHTITLAPNVTSTADLIYK